MIRTPYTDLHCTHYNLHAYCTFPYIFCEQHYFPKNKTIIIITYTYQHVVYFFSKCYVGMLLPILVFINLRGVLVITVTRDYKYIPAESITD